VRGKDVVVNFAACQHLGKLVANYLADAQLALRRAGARRSFQSA
jgi:hypothetical protein